MSIPGLELVSSESAGTVERSLELESFTGSFEVPESHGHGRCRRYRNFTKICNLKEGSFWKTYKCQDQRDGKIVLLKKFDPLRDADDLLTSVFYELDILNDLKHINLINLIETVSGKEVDSICLALEFCGYSLALLIEEKCDMIFEPPVVKYIMKSLCDGLSYIHAHKVIHRNINPENIMFNEAGVLKIGNLEDSCLASWKKKPLDFQSALCYRAPEVIYGDEDYEYPIDMWSAGCILAELLKRKPIFAGETVADVMRKVILLLGAPDDIVWPGYLQLPNAHEISNIKSYPHKISERVFMELSQSKECLLLVQNLLLYYPVSRLPAELCVNHVYFMTEPLACSVEEMAEKLSEWDSSKAKAK